MQGYNKLNESSGDENDTKLSQIKRCVREWYSYWDINNEYFRNKINFLQGDQWDSGTANYFALAKIPLITVNLSYLYAKQLIGEMIQNVPELEVIPKNMYVDQGQVDLFQDLIRTALINSNGIDQLQQCAKNIMCGYAAIHIGTRYTSFDSFQQEPYFEYVSDPTTCGWDPSASLPNKQDGDYAFRMRCLTKRQWRREFPGVPFRPSGFEGFNFTQNNMYSSNKRADISVVCEFYEKQYKNTKYVKVAPTIDGSPYVEIEEKEFGKYLGEYLEKAATDRVQSEMMGEVYMTPPMPQIVDRKTDKKFKVKCFMVRDDMILEEYDWIGQDIPVVFCDGDSWELDGQQHIKSLTHEAEDLQRILNYQWAFLIQFMKTSMKGKVFATPEQMKGFEQYYKNAELYHGAIPYNWVQSIGQPPHVIDAPTLRQEMLSAIQQTTQALMMALGRQESMSGSTSQGMQQSQPMSGKAYESMKIQQSTSNYIQAKNLWMAVKQVGAIFLDIFPKLYPDTQIITVYDKDFQHKQVQLNGQNPQSMQPQNEMKPIKATINVSPSATFEMQKAMERDYIVNLLQAGASNPQLFAVVADQLAQLSETSITPTIVRRLKTLVPPQVLAADDGKEFKPPQPQPNPQEQMMQKEMQLKEQELQLKGQEMQQNMQIKQQEHQLEAAKLQQASVEAMLDAHKNGVKTDAELKKAQMSLAATIATTQHKILATTEDHAHKRAMQHASIVHDMVKQKNQGQQQTSM